MSADFTEDDCVLVIGGTNDMPHPDSIIPFSQQCADISKHTNIIVSAIPHRFNRPEINANIDYANTLMYKVISDKVKDFGKPENVFVSTVMLNLDRSSYLNDQLHFKEKTKSKLCKKFTTQINVLLTSKSVDYPQHCSDAQNFP